MIRLFLAALFRKAVIPNIAVVGHHQGDALGAVHDRAAAEGDDEVTARIPSHLSAVHNVVIRRIGTHLVEDFIADAGQIQFFFYSIQIPETLGRRAVRRDDQGFFARKLFIMQILKPTGPEQNLRRHIEVKVIHEKTSFIDRYPCDGDLVTPPLLLSVYPV